MDIYKNSEVNLESEYEEFLRKNKKEYGTIKNYVRFIKPKYLKNISNYSSNINIYNISDLNTFQNIKDSIVNSDNYKDINKESSYSISSSLNQYEAFLKERQSSPTTIRDNNKVDLESEYRKFLESEPNLGGSGTVDKYVGILRNTTLSKLSYFKETKNNEIYSISDINIFKDTVKNIKNSTNYKEVNSEQNRTLSSSLNYYEKFLKERESQSSTQNSDESNKNDTHRKQPHQRIFFGAPGTGKSYLLNEEAKKDFEKECCERVTFHPNYMYGNFVGAFKPFPKKIGEQESITYKYIPGVLIRQLIEAYKNENINYLLIIEEINRANVAAVFGDIFQLLDRDINGESEYEITTSRELQEFLKKELKEVELSDNIKNKLGDNFSKIFLPSNLYIWATMNSADQGVMPIDTAFKRRWEFRYIGIDDAVDKSFANYKFKINSLEVVKWDDFRKEVNKRLSKLNIPEDKLIGPYFISKSILQNYEPSELTEVVKDKVLMYLYEDAARAYRSLLFAENSYSTYSKLCEEFQKDALNLFKDKLELKTEK
ncbi:McrBC 5-methylcytosine restriction system, component McrB [Campylobacter ureolyticus RIGS 9880]|uniref:McrBC 5-methylcytosine restriction system, component McrB n=1 Tax=Campylobacter ureolyticus RIGS 9880 TaxID=1032069 RepID=A0AAU8UCK7_9BACT|nr:AAA family ATPase [Campylobacter ureolyticus]AKT90734.1 McrBC 5-methylcytosine restriction system, component McrB [Campylobacter ureolyticus RIGS 9880]